MNFYLEIYQDSIERMIAEYTADGDMMIVAYLEEAYANAKAGDYTLLTEFLGM